MAKRAEEAEEYYKKCIDEANMRQNEIEKTRVCITPVINVDLINITRSGYHSRDCNVSL